MEFLQLLRKSGATFGDARVRPDSLGGPMPGMVIDRHQSCMHRFARMLTLAKGRHTEFIIVNKILVHSGYRATSRE